MILSLVFALIGTLLYSDFAKYVIKNGLIEEYKRYLILFAVFTLMCWGLFFYLINK